MAPQKSSLADSSTISDVPLASSASPNLSGLLINFKRRTQAIAGTRTASQSARLLAIARRAAALAAFVDSALMRSEEHTSELQSLMRISYAVFCLKKQKNRKHNKNKCAIQL